MLQFLSLVLGSTSGLITLFFLMFAASYVPIPAIGTILVSFGAAKTSIGGLGLLILGTYLATILGDISIYFITRRFSDKVLRFLKKFKWYQKNNKKTRLFLKKYGFWAVFFSRFTITEVNLVMNYISGFTKFNSKRFITAVLLGELIYSVFYASFGYIFKDTWNYLLGLLQDSFWVVLVIILAFFIAKKIIKLVKREEKLITQKNL